MDSSCTIVQPYFDNSTPHLYNLCGSCTIYLEAHVQLYQTWYFVLNSAGSGIHQVVVKVLLEEKTNPCHLSFKLIINHSSNLFVFFLITIKRFIRQYTPFIAKEWRRPLNINFANYNLSVKNRSERFILTINCNISYQNHVNISVYNSRQLYQYKKDDFRFQLQQHG